MLMRCSCEIYVTFLDPSGGQDAHLVCTVGLQRVTVTIVIIISVIIVDPLGTIWGVGE
jgi:hypothetical protein